MVPPLKHRVENLGDTPYEGIYIGIKGKLATANDSAYPMEAPTVDERRNQKAGRRVPFGSGDAMTGIA